MKAILHTVDKFQMTKFTDKSNVDQTLQLILLLVFGAMDEALASYMLIHL